MITIQEVLDQAHATFELVHAGEERYTDPVTGEFQEPDEFTDEELDQLWEFAFATFRAAEEDSEVDFTIEQLEDEFNSPRGCPTGN